MAKLTSSAANSKRFQSTIEFDREHSSIGYSNTDHSGPSVSLSFNADKERELGKFGRKAKLSERDVRLTLDEKDLTAILGRLVNPNYTMGFFIGGDSNNPADRLANRVLEACGLVGERYRYPWKQGREEYVHVYALNAEHADFQIKRVLGNKYDPSQLQVEHEYLEGGSTFHPVRP